MTPEELERIRLSRPLAGVFGGRRKGYKQTVESVKKAKATHNAKRLWYCTPDMHKERSKLMRCCNHCHMLISAR